MTRKVPDVAFMIGPLEETSKWNKFGTKVDLLFALRKDAESKYRYLRNEDFIRRLLDSNAKTEGLTFKLVDWDDAKQFVNKSFRDSEGPDFQFKVRL